MNIILVAIIDIILIHCGYVFSFFIRYLGEIPMENFSAYLAVSPWLTILVIILFYVYGLYDVVKKRWSDVYYSLICGVGLVLVSAVFISFVVRQFAFPRTVFLISFLIHIILLSIWRYFQWRLVRKKFGISQVIIVGAYTEAVALARKLLATQKELVLIKGIISDRLPEFEDERFPIIGSEKDVYNSLMSVRPNLVYICSHVKTEHKKEIIVDCLNQGIDFGIVPDLYDILLTNIKITQVDDIPVLTLKEDNFYDRNPFGKRMFDIMLSLVVLLLTTPLMILVGILIKIDSSGPVFYRQERVSDMGRTFNLLKFRTMVINAEKCSGPVLASPSDPRITRVGRFLRATRIDELPQFYNVLKGQMSVIGPRPERPFFVEQFARDIPEYRYRMTMKAGITGLAQISGKYSTTPEDKLKFDLLYSINHSPFNDFLILLHTLKVMLMRDKAL